MCKLNKVAEKLDDSVRYLDLRKVRSVLQRIEMSWNGTIIGESPICDRVGPTALWRVPNYETAGSGC
jgi:hypothetical protein